VAAQTDGYRRWEGDGDRWWGRGLQVGRGVEWQHVVQGVVEMAIDICPHCYRCALPWPPHHHIALPGSSAAAAASATDHHCAVWLKKKKSDGSHAHRERERGEDD
jgi:hypothetical protein